MNFEELMDISVEYGLVSSDDDMTFGSPVMVPQQKTSNARSGAKSALVESKSNLTTVESNGDIATTGGEPLCHDIDTLTVQTEVEVLLKRSPGTEIQKPVSRPSTTDDLSEKRIRLLVPLGITDGFNKVEQDANSNLRFYYNDYYEISIRMTEDQALWQKMDQDGFESGEVALIEYTLPTTEEVVTLYKSLNLYEDQLATTTMDNVSHKFRPDAVLIRGVNGMNTVDVFQYLRGYGQLPVKLEWVNDVQCIAVFPNEYEAARCILNLAKPISLTKNPLPPPLPEKFEAAFEQISEVAINWVEIPMPKSHVWRFTVSDRLHDPKPKPGFLMTLAKKSDKKQERAEVISDFYRAHGNPNLRGQNRGVWTKGGYEQQMRKKQENLALRRRSPPTKAANEDPVDIRPSVESRLGGSGDRRLSFADFDENENAAMHHFNEGNNGEYGKKLLTRLQRRSVTIQRRTDGRKQSGLGRRWSRRTRLNEYQDKDDTETEPVRGDQQRRGGASCNHLESADAERVARRRSVHSRLGW